MIHVVGEALIDAHLHGDVIRPHPGGGPYNTAVALARLGVPVTFSSAISTDPLGQVLRDRLRIAGVADGSFRVDTPTPLAIVAAGQTGEADYRFHLRGTAFDDLAALPKPRRTRTWCSSGRWLSRSNRRGTPSRRSV